MASNSTPGPRPADTHWTQQEPHKFAIERGLEWVAKTPPAETDLDKFLRQIEQERKRRREEGKR